VLVPEPCFEQGSFLTQMSAFAFTFTFTFTTTLTYSAACLSSYISTSNAIEPIRLVFLFYFAKPFQYLNPGFPVCPVVIRPANRTAARRCGHNSCTSVTYSRLAANMLAMELTFHATEILQSKSNTDFSERKNMLDSVTCFQEWCQNKRRLFHHAVSTDYVLYPRRNVLTAGWTQNP